MDSFIIFFDFEATGIPLWKEPSDSPDQPHIVQVAAELVDANNREIVDQIDMIVRPEGWTITAELEALHGISHERAMAEGVPERRAVESILKMRERADLRVAHNRTFDDRIQRIGLKRYFDVPEDKAPEGYDQPSDAWKDGKGFCTCQEARKALGLKKLPTLQEAHVALIGEEYEGAHNANNDTAACRAVYFALLDRARS